MESILSTAGEVFFTLFFFFLKRILLAVKALD